MGDVADMLGISHRSSKPANAVEEASKFINEKRNLKKSSNGIKKPKGVRREVLDLVGVDSLVPSVQTPSIGFKSKRVISAKGKWIYSPIESSARSDNQSTFYHWVRADKFYADYPYVQFNIVLDKLKYSDEEYNDFLVDSNWSKEDSDSLVNCCERYDLRWSIIADRIELSSEKTVDQMQARYYAMKDALKSRAVSSSSVLGSSMANNSAKFDFERESLRRRKQAIAFLRTKEEEAEESKLREELKNIDLLLKKTKKPNSKAASTSSTSGVGTRPNSSAVTDNISGYLEGGKKILSASVTAPMVDSSTSVPRPNFPCLQSTRLYIQQSDISPSVLSKASAYLKELNIPERPIPTKRVCELVENVRKDTQILIALHNQLSKKEKDLQAIKSGSVKVHSRAPVSRGNKLEKGTRRIRSIKDKASDELKSGADELQSGGEDLYFSTEKPVKKRKISRAVDDSMTSAMKI